MSTAYQDMLAVLEDLQESAAYWSEYDVPLGIMDRINAAIAKAKDTSRIQVTSPQIQATSSQMQVTSVNAQLLAASKAVITRWDSPQWKELVPTADYIAALRKAVKRAESQIQEAKNGD